MARRAKGILFDLGDTLLDFGQVNIGDLFRKGAKFAYDYLRSLGMTLPPFRFYHHRQLWAIRWRYAMSHLTRREFNSLDVISRLGRRMGHKLTDEQNLELSWRWYQPICRCATVEPGAREMLARFQADGIVLGVISNTFIPGAVLDRHLASENLLDLLPVRVYSSDAGTRKPGRRIFELALQQGQLRSEQTLFVGDSLRADIKGANRAGLVSVLKDPSGRFDRARVRPQHRIRGLEELADIVAGYNGP